jgi:hypothetical protein
MSPKAGRKHVVASLAALALLLILPTAFATPPLHQRIDQHIQSKATTPVAPAASDAEFLRRLYLDLAGDVPTAAEARAFLADTSPDKRSRIIDQLLQDPRFPRRMADVFNIMLMERRGTTDKNAGPWVQYLLTSFEQNKPWDALVREILSPNPEDPVRRSTAYFYTKRLEAVGEQIVDRPSLARDIGRLFLGRDVQCAQCHNHLSVKEYKQAEFQGLFAFVSHTYVRTDLAFPALGENVVAKKLDYISVLTGDKGETGPRLLNQPEIDIPSFPKGEEYLRPPDRKANFKGAPKFSPLKALSEQLPTRGNRAFVINSVNRLWFVYMGRGLVHPLDLHHAKNPPSHPELLEELADEFVKMNFDTRALIKQLLLTNTYQRSSILPSASEDAPESYTVANLRRLSAEQLARAFMTATSSGKLGREALSDPLLKKFLTAFANPPAEPEIDYTTSVAAALFLSNDKLILERLTPGSSPLIDRLLPMTDAAAIPEELYLSILTRFPTDEERADVAAHLARRGSAREQALRELAWALLASTEFCINH